MTTVSTENSPLTFLAARDFLLKTPQIKRAVISSTHSLSVSHTYSGMIYFNHFAVED